MLNDLRATRFPDAAFISSGDFLHAMSNTHPLALEEAYADLLEKAIAGHETVLVDDLHLLSRLACCHHFYPRHQYLEGPLTAVIEDAERRGRIVVFTHTGGAPDPIGRRCYYFGFKSFRSDDYAHLFRAHLPEALASRIEADKVHRFAPNLNGHQIRGACRELASAKTLDTEKFIEYLRARRMASNVDLSEVQAVDLSSLKGLDDVVESLEAHVVLPLENDALASELKLKPKRGVLIIGPPGTGKTSIGRALAHRLKSKFFLIDGTFISGTRDFYREIQQLVEAAKRNAPSIVFIDDSDVIFQGARDQGLYRYLLTLLDGVESEGVGQISVMMTAMDIANLPPALIRSGRIELWLETRLPDEAARKAILVDLFRSWPAGIPVPDSDELVAATDGLTGADIKALAEDGKILFAHDKARGRPLRSSTQYVLSAIRSVRSNKERYAAAEARAKTNSAFPGGMNELLAAMGSNFDFMTPEDEEPS
ncbi:MAG: 26S protease regulatory subunit [Deltaproteobacteria bacterium]|nr:26S protease regulatory subunit [Deltaproteobacteria bacterium]